MITVNCSACGGQPEFDDSEAGKEAMCPLCREMLLITAASSISQQIFSIYSQSAISTRWRTLMSGVVNTTMGCGWAITAWGGGLIIEHFGYNKVFLTGAATTVISVAVFALVARRAPEPTR